MMPDNILYHYYRSSSSYRVRIALNLKGVPYEMFPISLLQHEHKSADYLKINPQGLVPTWIDEKISLSQSLAIIEYLDERYPQPQLIPNDLILKAHVRQFSLIIACEIHPLNNLCVREYLQRKKWSESEIMSWYHHWLKQGFDAYEALLKQLNYGQHYTLNQNLSMADLCLIPQIYNAKRFEFNMDKYPIIMDIYQNCQSIDAFKKAYPSEQK
jgi:maleylacetoacetate isomerase